MGTVPLSHAQLRFMSEITAQTGTLLVFDEMITGFRFSPGGVQAQAGVTPDITTLGKILTGGLPGGAVVGREDVMGVMDSGRSLDEVYAIHYGTFNAHPLVAAVGIETMRAVSNGKAQEAAARHAGELRTGLQSIFEELGIDGFPYGESSTFHLYLRMAGAEAESAAKPETTTPSEYLTMPATLIEALNIELRMRGVDLMSYNGGVASSAHGPLELDSALESFKGALTAMRDAKLVATR